MKANKAWIIGASSGLGRQLAESLAANGVSVILSARHVRDLEANCQHIRNVYRVSAEVFPLDLAEVRNTENARTMLNALIRNFGMPDSCYMIAGSIDDSDAHLEAASCLPQLMTINFTGPALILSELIRLKPESGTIQLVVASSVAAIRPRSKNMAYGTAKKSLEQFCLGLLHSQADRGVKIQIVRFGYMDTNLSYGYPLPFPAAGLDGITGKVIALEKKSSGLYYLPSFWRIIAIVLQLTPFFIYKKLKI